MCCVEVCRDCIDIAFIERTHQIGHARGVGARAAAELADRGSEIGGALMANARIGAETFPVVEVTAATADQRRCVSALPEQGRIGRDRLASAAFSGRCPKVPGPHQRARLKSGPTVRSCAKSSSCERARASELRRWSSVDARVRRWASSLFVRYQGFGGVGQRRSVQGVRCGARRPRC